MCCVYGEEAGFWCAWNSGKGYGVEGGKEELTGRVLPWGVLTNSLGP